MTQTNISDYTFDELTQLGENYLEHFGVKGMHWGVRNDRDRSPSARRLRYEKILNAESKTFEVKARNGKIVTVSQDKNDKVTAFIASLRKNGVERNAKFREDSPSFKFYVDGKHVGEAGFDRNGRNGDDPTELNLVWLGINQSERGKGYGSAVFDAAVQYGRETGAKKLTLEVPGNSPDARHIYEKQGFKATWEPTAKQAKADTYWGGLTDMELDLTNYSISHSELSEDESLELALIQSFPQLDEDQENLVFGKLTHTIEIHEEEGSGMTRLIKTDDFLDDYFLEHFGVKGMRWGVRHDPGHEGERVRNRQLSKLDKKWEKENTGVRGFVKMHNMAADAMNNGGQDKINAKPEYANAMDSMFNDQSGPLFKQYLKETEDAFNLEFMKAGASIGMNPSGTKKFQTRIVNDETNELTLEIVNVGPSLVKHASDGEVLAIYDILRDKNGMITKYVLRDSSVEHFGVKGMHWGVRKDVSVKATPGKYVKTSGGTKQTASEDAIAAATYRQKAKKSTTDSLSNKELQSLVTRMNLEQQYSDLSAKSPRMNIAQKFLQKFKSNDKFRNKTIAQAKQVADSSPARKLERSLGEALKGM